jgi:hypothetical protein
MGFIGGALFLVWEAVDFALTATFKYLGGIKDIISRVNNVLHLKTLMEIHEIAIIVSEDYRNLVRKVYKEISKVSDQLGWGPVVLLHILNNTRNIILDTAATFGKKYDIGEAAWILTLDKTLTNMQNKFESYKADPSALFDDLNEWVVRPAVEEKSTHFDYFLSRLETTFDRALKATGDVAKVNADLSKFITDLPDPLKSPLKPFIDKVIKPVADFQTNILIPWASKADEVLSVLTQRADTIQVDHDNLAARLKTPGKFLKEIDGLSDEDRFIEELVIGEIATRSALSESLKVAAVVAEGETQLKAITEALKTTTPVPGYLTYELEGDRLVPQKFTGKRNSWFAGDY